MKKMLTTLMVLAIVLVATTAMAGDMDWKFYGKLHTSINTINNGEDSALSLTSNTSRFGFKGGKEMNENFTFIWQFESSVNIAQKETGNASLANRNSYLGLKGKWGKALWGIHDTPYKTLGRKTTFFYDSIGDNRQVMMHTDYRNDDYIMYFSPDFSGFGFSLGYEFDQVDKYEFPEADAASSFAGMLHYAKNEFFFGFAYETLTKGFFFDGDVNPEPESEARMRIAGKYDAEAFALALSYQNLSNYMGIKDWKSSTVGGEAMWKASPVFNVKGGYYLMNPDSDKLAGEDWGASLLSIGVDYNYVKNVQFYLQYAGIMNEDNGSWGLGDYNGFGTYVDPSEMGKTVSGFSFGTVVKF